MNQEPSTVSPATIALKNDQLRKMIPHLPFPHRCVLTDEIATLPENQLAWVINQVRSFSDFNENNDPHGEHDFGSFDLEGQTVFWKFDYFDSDLKYFEENGTRILTIMYAHEY